MIKKDSVIIQGSCERPILIDFNLSESKRFNHVVIFSHGFKGFKDWGPFNDVAEYFAANGFIFVKFNFSFNGTSVKYPCDFVDLDAFGNNNFCKELDDLGLVVDWVESRFPNSDISLLGHSRGGSISILKSVEDNRVSNVISWASPSDFLNKLPTDEKARKWKETGVAYIYNGRTKQNMPLYYQFYQNCLANKSRLNIGDALSIMRVPHLHVHGDADPTVLIDEAYKIKGFNSNTQLCVIHEADHVFGGSHPFHLKDLPRDLNEAIDATIDFLKG